MPSQDPARRAVVTGLGAITPIGNDHPTFWRNLVAGVSGAGPITSFDPTDVRRPDRRRGEGLRPGDRDGPQDGAPDEPLHALRDGCRQRGGPRLRHRLRGLVARAARPRRGRLNTGGGGQEAVVDGTHVLESRGPGQVSPFAIPALSGSMAACQVSMEYGLTGPVITQVAACACSVIAFLDALRMIQRGEVDVVLAGGTEAPLLPVAFAALGNMGALSKRNDEPEKASRPFDRDRDGFLFGEGAGVVVVESLAHALERGATIQAELIGAALTADAFHISAPEPTGRGACMAMTKALQDAGIAPDEVDYIAAHGTSTPLNDVTETRAIKGAFGDHAHRLAISSPKSMVGHLLGAAGVDRRARGDRRHSRRASSRRRSTWTTPTSPSATWTTCRNVARQATGRHGDDQRLRLRRPERGGGLPPLRGVAITAQGTGPAPNAGRAPRTGPAPNVADAMAAAFVEAGVERAFTVPGESFLALLDSLVAAGIRVIATRHEGGASFMAEATGKLTGRPSMCMGTRAVGTANLAIGIHTARQDSTPMIAVSGRSRASSAVARRSRRWSSRRRSAALPSGPASCITRSASTTLRGGAARDGLGAAGADPLLRAGGPARSRRRTSVRMRGRASGGRQRAGALGGGSALRAGAVAWRAAAGDPRRQRRAPGRRDARDGRPGRGAPGARLLGLAPPGLLPQRPPALSLGSRATAPRGPSSPGCWRPTRCSSSAARLNEITSFDYTIPGADSQRGRTSTWSRGPRTPACLLPTSLYRPMRGRSCGRRSRR